MHTATERVDRTCVSVCRISFQDDEASDLSDHGRFRLQTGMNTTGAWTTGACWQLISPFSRRQNLGG